MYQCWFSGYDILLQLCMVLSSEVGVYRRPLYYFINFCISKFKKFKIMLNIIMSVVYQLLFNVTSARSNARGWSQLWWWGAFLVERGLDKEDSGRRRGTVQFLASSFALNSLYVVAPHSPNGYQPRNRCLVNNNSRASSHATMNSLPDKDTNVRSWNGKRMSKIGKYFP